MQAAYERAEVAAEKAAKEAAKEAAKKAQQKKGPAKASTEDAAKARGEGCMYASRVGCSDAACSGVLRRHLQNDVKSMV